jgi:hypothetical protein
MVVKIYPDGIFALGKTLLGEAFESCKHKKEKKYILINYCSHGFYFTPLSIRLKGWSWECMWSSRATLVSSIAVLNAFPILSCVLFKLRHSWNTQSFNLELENVLCNMVNAWLPTDDLRFRLNFNLSKNNEIYHHS